MVIASSVIDTCEDRATLLAAVADPMRLRLLDQLAEAGTRCVCNLQTDPPIASNLLSYHLRVLREARLVTAQKRGRWVDYTLAEDALERLALALPRPDSAAVGAGSCGAGGAG